MSLHSDLRFFLALLNLCIFPGKQRVLAHVGTLRFFVAKKGKDVLLWSRATTRDQLKVTMSTKV